MNREGKEEGWIIVSKEGRIMEFTYQRTRSETIKKWCNLWTSSLRKWKNSRYAGYRCIRAKRTISLTHEPKQ